MEHAFGPVLQQQRDTLSRTPARIAILRSEPFHSRALFLGLVGAGAALALGVYTLQSPGSVDKTTAPAGMSFFFGTVLLLASAGDIRMLAHGGIAGRRRIIRHLWRMCYGLFIATGSFFLGQQQVFPASLRGSVFLTVLALLPLPLLIYWFLRVRFSKVYNNRVLAKPVPATT